MTSRAFRFIMSKTYSFHVVKFHISSINKHRHQRCKAPSLCNQFFITNICRSKEAGQKKYLSYNVFLTTSFLTTSFFFTTSFSQRLSHNIFLTTSFSQRLSHNVFLTASLFHRCPYIIIHTR